MFCLFVWEKRALFRPVIFEHRDKSIQGGVGVLTYSLVVVLVVMGESTDWGFKEAGKFGLRAPRNLFRES